MCEHVIICKITKRFVPILILLAEWENDGQRVVRDGLVEQAVEVQTLQVLLLAHESLQGRRPTLCQNLQIIPSKNKAYFVSISSLNSNLHPLQVKLADVQLR